MRRKKKTRELVDAPDAVSAILNHSKIGNKLNSSALNKLFNDPIHKKLKVEGGSSQIKYEEENGSLLKGGFSRGITIKVDEDSKQNMTAE